MNDFFESVFCAYVNFNFKIKRPDHYLKQEIRKMGSSIGGQYDAMSPKSRSNTVIYKLYPKCRPFESN